MWLLPFSAQRTQISPGIPYLSQKKKRVGWELSKLEIDPAGLHGCKTYLFYEDFLGLTGCKHNTECRAGAQFVVNSVMNRQLASATRQISTHAFRPSEAEPCHNDKQRPVVALFPDANLCVGTCSAGNKNSMCTQPTFRR